MLWGGLVVGSDQENEQSHRVLAAQLRMHYQADGKTIFERYPRLRGLVVFEGLEEVTNLYSRSESDRPIECFDLTTNTDKRRGQTSRIHKTVVLFPGLEFPDFEITPRVLLLDALRTQGGCPELMIDRDGIKDLDDLAVVEEFQSLYVIPNHLHYPCQLLSQDSTGVENRATDALTVESLKILNEWHTWTVQVQGGFLLLSRSVRWGLHALPPDDRRRMIKEGLALVGAITRPSERSTLRVLPPG